MVRVYLQNGSEALVTMAHRVEGATMSATDSDVPAIVCLNREGEPVGHFRLDQIAGYHIEDRRAGDRREGDRREVAR